MNNCSKFVSDKTGSVVFVRKNNQIICSETWESAYRLIFQTKATVEYIDLDSEYSTTRVDAKADAENFAITIFVPAECGKDSKLLEITYSLTDGISEKEVLSELSDEKARILHKEGAMVKCKPNSNKGFAVTAVNEWSFDQHDTLEIFITGRNLYDFVSAFGGVGHTESKSGVTLTVLNTGEAHVVGTNGTTGYVDFKINNIPADYWFPAGTYTLPAGLDIRFATISGKTGAKWNTFYMEEQWKITDAIVSVVPNTTVDKKVPLVLAAGRVSAITENLATYMPFRGWRTGIVSVPGPYYGMRCDLLNNKMQWTQNGTIYNTQTIPGKWMSRTNNLDQGALVVYDLNSPVEVSGVEYDGPEYPDVENEECYIWSTWNGVAVDYSVDYPEYADYIAQQTKAINPDDWSTLKQLKLYGDTTKMTKDVKSTLDYLYYDPTTKRVVKGTLSMKWQGSSSLAYPKKNYTISDLPDIEFADGWGKQTKYCLKANYIDHSQARNIVSAKLWGEVVKSRNVVPDGLGELVNAGAVDGFTVLLYINDEYHGLYTLNIPKDGWMMGMPTAGATNEAIVCAEGYSDATRFKGLATEQNFAIEYVTDKANSGWVIQSVNALIQAVMDSEGTNLDTTLAQYVDWQSAIDYYIFTVLVTGADMMDKNYLMFTRDGVKWYFSAYDLDTTYGLQWDGKAFYPATYSPTFEMFANYHTLFGLIKNHKKAELKTRYAQLRAGALSESNVACAFSNFIGSIPTPVYDSDVERWPSIPSSAASNLAQIISHYMMRCALADKWIEQL